MSNFLALIVTMFTVLTRADLVVLCKLPGGEVLSMTARECLKRGGRVVKPTTTPTPRPTVTPTISPTVSPTSTPTPTPTKTPTPTPTPSNKITISKVEVFDGTSGESTYGYVTGVKATGNNIGSEARMKVKTSGIEYSGMYQGGDGYSYILTDFLGLPHCKSFDVIVSGNNGVATASSAFSTVCP